MLDSVRDLMVQCRASEQDQIEPNAILSWYTGSSVFLQDNSLKCDDHS